MLTRCCPPAYGAVDEGDGIPRSHPRTAPRHPALRRCKTCCADAHRRTGTVRPRYTREGRRWRPSRYFKVIFRSECRVFTAETVTLSSLETLLKATSAPRTTSGLCSSNAIRLISDKSLAFSPRESTLRARTLWCVARFLSRATTRALVIHASGGREGYSSIAAKSQHSR